MSKTRVRRAAWYTYTGTEFPWMTLVRTVKPLSNGRWEVMPWIPEQDRCSYVTSDPLRGDLTPASAPR